MLFFEIWGGTWFTLNKLGLFLNERFERRGDQEKKWWWEVAAWIFYLIGLPGWLVIFAYRDDWIVFSTETAGIIPISIALANAWQRKKGKKGLSWKDYLCWIAAVLGTYWSYQKLGGLDSFNQALEWGSTLGLFVGAWLLGLERRWVRTLGYFFFLVMNASMGILVFRQGHLWLFAQQTLSLGLVIWAAVEMYRKKKA